MAFDKVAYWKRRNNTIKVKNAEGKEVEVKKPLRGQGDIPKPQFHPSKDVEIGFDNVGNTVVKNREYRRRRFFVGHPGYPGIKRPQTKKGFNPTKQALKDK